MKTEGATWDHPPPSGSVAGGEVHVWRATLDLPAAAMERLETALNVAERARADRYATEPLRNHFVAARGTLRTVLARYLGTDPAAVAFRTVRNGKPVIDGPGDLMFNLSHSKGAALIAVASGRRVGVDLEQVRPMRDFEALAERFFAPAERDELRALAAEERQAAFFRAWTRKEAYIKATGEGIAAGLERFAVTMSPGVPALLRHVEGRPGEASRWSLCDLDPWPGFAAALAVEGPPPVVARADARHLVDPTC